MIERIAFLGAEGANTMTLLTEFASSAELVHVGTAAAKGRSAEMEGRITRQDRRIADWEAAAERIFVTDDRPTTLERAYELARSGDCANLTDIKRRLEAENYEHVHAQLIGATLRRDLLRLCAAAQGKEPPKPPVR